MKITTILSFILALVIVTSISISTRSTNPIINMHGFATPTFAQLSDQSQQDRQSSTTPYLGVAMKGYNTTIQAEDDYDEFFPSDFYEESFRLIHDAGMNHVRYLFYWESYEKNPSAFMKELISVAETADKWGIKVLYDNHQWHTSSWLEKQATGFPSFLFQGNSDYEKDSGGNTDDESAKIWWTDWWNRSIKDVQGNDGWMRFADFWKELVNTLDDHPSTLGYEILSEPQIHDDDQWEKVGQFNSFMVNEFRKVTNKTIAFSQQVPASINSETIDVIPENIAKMAPEPKTDTVFKVSLYGVPSDPYHGARLNVLVEASSLAGVPLYIGEWNNVVRESSGGVYRIDPEASDISQGEVDEFLESFEDLNVWGAAYWHWNFKPHSTPNFNLIEISQDGNITPTKYYEQLKNSLSSIEPV
jgi:Cellulase (glycosyl hydrolase family 5)